MLPIHAFVADVECPPGVSAADWYAEVGGVFIDWVQGAFADVPGFVLPADGSAEPIPGSIIRVESDRPDDADERFRITLTQPALFDGGECVQEYAVARAGGALSACVNWHLTATGPIPPEYAQPDRPAVLDRLAPFVGAALDDRHPLDGLARRDRGGAFRAVEAALAGQRAAAAMGVAALYADMEQENLALAAQRADLLLEVDGLNETVFDQRSQILVLSGRKCRDNGGGNGFEPASLAEALERVKAEFPNELVFLKSAEESAAKSPYQSAARVYALLHALGDIARKWRTNSLGMEWFEAFQKVDPSFIYKPHLSQTTSTNNWDDYAFQYNGVRRIFEAHVSLGKSHDPKKCISVHWYRDEDAKRVVVGWCGRHLPNTKS